MNKLWFNNGTNTNAWFGLVVACFLGCWGDRPSRINQTSLVSLSPSFFVDRIAQQPHKQGTSFIQMPACLDPRTFPSDRTSHEPFLFSCSTSNQPVDPLSPTSVLSAGMILRIPPAVPFAYGLFSARIGSGCCSLQTRLDRNNICY